MKTRFKTEAKGISEMAFLIRSCTGRERASFALFANGLDVK